MAFTPLVLYPLTLPALLNYILTTQSSTAPTTLIVCSSREAFLYALSRSLQRQRGREAEADSLQPLTTPTLHNLFTARHVHVAFCVSVQALLAHLRAYSGPATKRNGISEGTGKERLVLVNPLSLHAPTPSFSAQGLSRTFAAATETALRVGADLQMMECLRLWRAPHYHGEDEDMDAPMGSGDEGSQAEVEEDPWEQEVSILNVSARRFGSGSSDRIWAGRTIKVKRIAGRWFHFHKLDSLHGQQEAG